MLENCSEENTNYAQKCSSKKLNVALILNFVRISYGVICMEDFGE